MDLSHFAGPGSVSEAAGSESLTLPEHFKNTEEKGTDNQGFGFGSRSAFLQTLDPVSDPRLKIPLKIKIKTQNKTF